MAASRRAIMVDVDGVIVSHPDPAGWSTNLERDLGVPIDALQRAFFIPHWNDVVLGRVGLRQALAPALATFAPSVTVDRLVDYWFRNDAHINRSLFDEIANFRRGGVEVHLATNQEHERAHYLWHRLDLRHGFDGIHYSASLGCAKPADRFFRSVQTAIGLDASSIFFVDDRTENIAAAEACGWTAALWTASDTLAELIRRTQWDAR